MSGRSRRRAEVRWRWLRRMAETAAHRTDRVLPELSVRPQVLAVPKRLRYFWKQEFFPVIDAIQGDGFNPLWQQILIGSLLAPDPVGI